MATIRYLKEVIDELMDVYNANGDMVVYIDVDQIATKYFKIVIGQEDVCLEGVDDRFE